MDAETVEQIALTSDLKAAKQAVRSLQKQRDTRSLLEVAEDVPIAAVKAEAIKAVGEIGGKREAKSFIDRLDRLNTVAVPGGSDQLAEVEMLKQALIVAIAKLTKSPAPGDLSVAAVKTFIADSKRKVLA
jgi:hypothetical protein